MVQQWYVAPLKECSAESLETEKLGDPTLNYGVAPSWNQENYVIFTDNFLDDLRWPRTT